MTHSQQPSIDIICNQLVDEKTSEVLQKILNEIYSVPQEPTTDSLLEELSASIDKMLDGSNQWRAFVWKDEFDIQFASYGTSPRLALLALKDKLSTNQ